jgi:hypothetical protein
MTRRGSLAVRSFSQGRRLWLAIAVLVLVPLVGPAASMQQVARHAIQLDDIIAWKSASAAVVAGNGQWYGYRLAPQEGDAEVVIKRIHGDGKELRFPIGEVPAAGDGGGGGRGAAGGAAARSRFQTTAGMPRS